MSLLVDLPKRAREFAVQLETAFTVTETRRDGGAVPARCDIRRPDARVEILERGSEPSEIVVVARRTNVCIEGRQRRTVEYRSQAADEHISHTMTVETRKKHFRLECGHADLFVEKQRPGRTN